MNELEFWRWALTQLDRQISGDNDLTVKWMPHDRVCDCWGYTERAPGCSSVISLDRDAVTGWFRDLPARRAITRLMGLNLHEVGHVLFTPSIDLDAMGPYAGIELRSWDHQIFNILEDQRIERLMIARHRAASRPIIECSEALVSVRDPFAAVVLHGRRHVRPVLRDTADATFARRHGRKAYEQLARIVDEYVAIDDRGRTNRMMSLTGHFARFLTDLGIVESCASA